MLLAGSFASCSGGETPATGSETTAQAASDTGTTAPETTLDPRASAKDSIPALDFKGRKVTILSRDFLPLFKSEFYATEETGDLLNDTIFKRNRSVEERLGVDFNVTLATGQWGKEAEFRGVVTSAAMSGDKSIDFTAYYAFHQPTLAAAGCYLDFLDGVPYVDLEAPWWFDYLTDSASINGKLYMVTGEIGISTIAMAAAIAFNKRLASEYLKGEDLYDIAREGKWTFDKMFGYAADLYKDVDGDGAKSAGDIYGFDGGRGDQFIHSAGVRITGWKDGKPYLAMNSERMTKLVDTVQAFFSKPGYLSGGYKSGTTTDNDFLTKMFTDGQLLFTNRYVRDIATLRDMEDDYGVLPMPKLTEDQDKYYTTLGDSYSQIAIMVTTGSVEAAAATIEALAAESYRAVTNTYYETVLKVKLMRDTDTTEMLDILVDGIDVDFSEIFAVLIGAPVGKMRNVLQETKAEFASTYAGIEQGVNTKMLALYDTFK